MLSHEHNRLVVGVDILILLSFVHSNDLKSRSKQNATAVVAIQEHVARGIRVALAAKTPQNPFGGPVGHVCGLTPADTV